MQGRRVLRHQGVPLFPIRMPLAYAAITVLLVVPVLGGALLNAPPLLIAWMAARRFADDTNVIALWRILPGVPLLVLWAAAWMIVAAVLSNAWLALTYFGLTAIPVGGCYRPKKLGVAAWNGLFHAEMRTELAKVTSESESFSTRGPFTSTWGISVAQSTLPQLYCTATSKSP